MKEESAAVIKAENIGIYHGDVPLFTDVSFDVHRGDRAVISGRSGSGKTSLLRSILGFEPLREGELQILGQPVDAKSIWPLRRQLGYVAQEPQLGRGTVESVIYTPFHFKANLHLHPDRSAVEHLLQTLLLSPEILTKNVSLLSGGEKQRIALLIALLLHREILLLDEITSALDRESKNAVVEHLNKQKELTMLAVSHEPESMGFDGPVISLDRMP